MTFANGRHYFVKLVANSTWHKLISASIVTFLGIIQPNDYIIFHMLLWLRVASMIFGTWNGIAKNGFNMRKFCMGGAKIITYVILLYFAQSLEIITHVNIWVEVFTGFMIFELLLSILKHCAELGIPMPVKLIAFVKKQEKEFEEKFISNKK